MNQSIPMLVKNYNPKKYRWAHEHLVTRIIGSHRRRLTSDKTP